MIQKVIPRKDLQQMMEQSIIMNVAEDARTPAFRAAMDKRIMVAQKIAGPLGLDWLALTDLMEAIYLSRGFKPDATIEDLERVLSVLGWQVSDK